MAAFSTPHQVDVPQFPHADGELFGSEKLLHKVASFIGAGGIKERAQFVRGRNSPREVEVDSATPGAIVSRRRRRHAALVPTRGDERVDGLGRRGIRGRLVSWNRLTSATLVSRLLSEGYDPFADDAPLLVGQLLFRRHVRIRIRRQELIEPALLRLPGDDHLANRTAAQDGFGRVKFQLAVLLERSVTLNAVHVKQRLNFLRPKSRRILRACPRRDAEHEEDQDKR